jgi:hypothetical protein
MFKKWTQCIDRPFDFHIFGPSLAVVIVAGGIYTDYIDQYEIKGAW